MADSRLTELDKIGQSGGRNPIQETEYQNLKRQQQSQPSYSVPNYASATPASTPNLLDTAKQLQQFQVQANQPAIQTLQSQQGDLKTKYDDLLASIKGQQATAEGYTTRATSSELGRRGLLPQSEEGQRTIASALQPLASQYQGLTAQTGLAQEQDMMSLAQKIASLQAGNPEGASSQALSLLGVQQSASNAAAQIALQQQQMQQQTDQAAQDEAYRQMVYQNIQLPQSQYETNRPYYQPAQTPSNNEAPILQKIFGAPTAPQQTPYKIISGGGFYG